MADRRKLVDEIYGSEPAGLRRPGNIDLAKRPRVRNPDGSISTVRSMGTNIDGMEYLIPTVVGDRVVSDRQAIDEFRRTGKHLGAFDTPENSSRYAEQLHLQQQDAYAEAREALTLVGEELGDTPPEEVEQTIGEARRRGMPPQQLLLRGLGKAKEQAVMAAASREQAAQRLADANERAAAMGEATRFQQLAGGLADALNTLSGAKPGELRGQLETLRAKRRERAEKSAATQYGAEIAGIEGAQQDTLYQQGQQDRTSGLEAEEGLAEILRAEFPGKFPAGTPAKAIIEISKSVLSPERVKAAQAEASKAAADLKFGRDKEIAGIRADATVDAAGERARNKPPTQGQSDAATFADMMSDGMSSVDSSGYNPNASTTRVERNLPPEAQSKEYQLYRQGVKIFAQAVLRDLTGAAARDQEIDDIDQIYFPQPGEGPEVVAQKKRSREVQLRALRRASGRALESGADASGAVDPAKAPPPSSGGEIQTRMIGGQPVQVRKLPNGQWQEVQ